MVFSSKLIISLNSAAPTLTSSTTSSTTGFILVFTALGAAEVMLLKITSLSAAVLTSRVWDKVDDLALTVFESKQKDLVLDFL